MKKFLATFCVVLLCITGFAETHSFTLDEIAEYVFFMEDKILVKLQDARLQKLEVSNLKVRKLTEIKTSGKPLLIVQSKDDGTVFLLLTEHRDLEKLNAKTGKFEKANLKAEISFIESLSFLATENKIAAGLNSGLVGISEELKTLNADLSFKFLTHREPVYSIDFNANGKYFLTASTDNKIKVWESSMFTKIAEFDFYSDSKLPAIFSPAGEYIAATTSQKTLHIKKFSNEATLINAENGIVAFKFTPDGRFLAVQNTLCEIEFYDVTNGKLYGRIKTNLQDIADFAFNKKAKVLAVSDKNKNLLLFDVQKEMELVKDDPEKKENADTNTPQKLKSLADEVHNIVEEPEKAEPKTDTAQADEKKETETPKEQIAEKPASESENTKPETPDFNKKDETKFDDVSSDTESETQDTKDSEFTFKTKAQNDAIELGSTFATYTKNPYYVGTLNCTLGYFFYKWTAPFYFGADFGFGLGFHSKKFPYEYYIGEKKLKSPWAVDITISAPLGFYFMPFDFPLAFGGTFA